MGARAGKAPPARRGGGGVNGFEFYLSMYCRSCDEEITDGPCMTFTEHKGLPVIPFDLAAQESFTCDNCGARNFTGEFEVYREDEV